MPVSKDIIRLSFSKAIDSYEKEVLIQKQTALKLYELTKNLEGLGIDLGCGTGSVITKNTVGLDISFGMAKIYKRKNENVVVGDIENLPFKTGSFDFAVSNFSLHWTDIRKSFKEISRILKPKSRFVFCMPVEGSLKIVEKILGEKNFDFLEVKTVLESLSYHFLVENYQIKSYQMEFKNAVELLKHLHLTGSSVGKLGHTVGEKKRIFNKFKQYNKPAVLNFEVIFVDCFNLRF